MKKAFLACAVALATLAVLLRFGFTGFRFGAALLAAGALYCLLLFCLWGKKAPAARVLRAVLLVALAAGLVLFLVAEIPVLRDCHSDNDTHAPALIVCGAGVNGTHPSRSLLDRLETAQTWLEENPQSLAVLSGSQGRGEDITEARAMYDWLTGQGVEPERLLLEEEAHSSSENISRSLAVLQQAMGSAPEKVAILSSDYHMHRLRCMAEDLGVEPVLVAARTGIVPLFVNYAIREAFAMWKLWLLGI